jgi:hypothetical protein
VIYFLLLFFGDSEMVGWNRFLYGGSFEDVGNNYNVDILTDLTTWILLFSDDDIKTEIVSSSWNNFLRSILCFIVLRSSHDEKLGRISVRSFFLNLRL